jgi:hypothetical protein
MKWDKLLVNSCTTFVLIGVCLTSCNESKAVDLIIENHLATTGFDGDLDSKAYCLNGNLEIERYGINVPFSVSTDGKSYYVFDQMELKSEYPSDYLPSFSKLMFDEKAFLVTNFSLTVEQLKKLKSNKDFDEHKIVFWEEFPKAVYDNWKSTELTVANPVLLLKQMGYNFKLDGKTQFNAQNAYVVTAFSPSSQITLKLFINTKTLLLEGMVFNSFHPQMGEVEITRKVNSYANNGPFRYVQNWTDSRAGTEVNYSVTNFEMVDEPTHIAQISKATKVFPLPKAGIEDVINTYLAELKETCPDSTVVAKIEHGLQLKLLNGEFTEELSPGILASRLNREILNLTGEHQHRIFYDPLEYMFLQEKKEVNPTNISIHPEDVGNYIYLKMDKIPELATVKPNLDAMMLTAQKKDALIIDLRESRGGDPEFNRYMMSFFLPPNQPLYTKQTKGSHLTVKVPNNPIRIDRSLEVYVVISDETSYEAEQLTYMMQTFKVGKIIGETSYGATQSPKRTIIGDGIIAEIPISKEIHTVTDNNWDNMGVIPDIIQSVEDKEKILGTIDSLRIHR